MNKIATRNSSTFGDVEIDYRQEYTEARRLMGDISTDLVQLSRTVGLLYMACPDDFQYQYAALLHEITERQLYSVARNNYEN